MGKPFTPTRTCPHRLCRPLHPVPAPFGLAIVSFDLWHNPLWLLSFVACGVGGWYVIKAVHFRRTQRQAPATPRQVLSDLQASPTPVDLEMEDALYEGTGWRTLEVRPVWAHIAVAMDMVWVAIIGLVSVSLFADYDKQAALSSEGPFSHGVASALGYLIAFAMIAFTVYAHKKATTPRKPKKAWLPAFLRTNV